eukprot:TRINITY_DN147_c0_g1_i1.p1 TRINITY_DN147_c0_g1~~TRINITY_DN147_c0_g1_i1.p1  ORF type:complete len:379 (+),score=49.24 TRINITY_DN147_c0_g1_i1:38-1138(+)
MGYKTAFAQQFRESTIEMNVQDTVKSIQEGEIQTSFEGEKILPTKKCHKCPYPECGKVFKESGNLRRHIRSHTGERPYACTYIGCNKAFLTKGHLQVHVLIHTGDKPYTCKFCDKKYSRDSRLKIHERIHTGERPYRCTFKNCTKTFTERGNYKTHMRTHTGEKPYECSHPGCSQRFTTAGHLKEHSMKHGGLTTYACEFCDAKYFRLATYQKHLKVHPKANKTLENLPNDPPQPEAKTKEKRDSQPTPAESQGAKNNVPSATVQQPPAELPTFNSSFGPYSTILKPKHDPAIAPNLLGGFCMPPFVAQKSSFSLSPSAKVGLMPQNSSFYSACTNYINPAQYPNCWINISNSINFNTGVYRPFLF